MLPGDFDPGCAGADFAGACCFSKTLPDDPALRVAMIASVNEVNMNTAAAMVVALERTVADPRGPNAVCDPMPPNAPAKSAAFPLCSRTTTTRKKHTRT
jgi:hypothetical protein